MRRLNGGPALILALVATWVPTASVEAQEGDLGRGRLMGQIINQDTGTPLSGTQIQVEEASRGVLSGIEGRYQLDDVPPGTFSVRFTYLGYGTKVVTGVEILAGQTTRLDVSLERQAVELEGVTVTAQQERGSSIRLIDEQRNAASLVSAISAEQIGRSPDGDAAAAMRRVSGVTVRDGKFVYVRGMGERYTTSSLNGIRIPSPDPERKIVPLDLFPTGLLQSITTSKTFTPDQPGDFSGGSVNIRTPDFPLRRTLSFSIGSGYHPDIIGGLVPRGPTAGTQWLALGARDREIPTAARNFSGTETRGPEVNAVIDSFRNVWRVQEDSGRLPASLSASAGGSGDVMGRTIGYLGSLSYANAEEVRLRQTRARYAAGDREIDRYDGIEGISSVSLGAMANVSVLLGSHSQLHVSNTLTRNADSQARREVGLDENTRSTVQVERLTYVERSVRSHQLQGQHQMGHRHRLDWTASASAVSRSEPDRSEFVTWLDPETPIWLKNFEGAVRTFGALRESAHEGSATYALKFDSNRGDPNQIRVGVVHRRVDRDAESLGFRIQPFQWSPTDERWQLAPEEFFDGRYTTEGDSLFILAPEQSGGAYQATDRLSAAYLMGEWNATGRIRLLGGVRVEESRLELDSENTVGQRRRTDARYTDVLPAISGIVTLTDAQQLRLSASQTLARPEYRELAPLGYREVLGGERVTGNPDLERTLIRNLDVRWEWYPRVGEVVSVAAFGKWFDAPIEDRYTSGSGTDTRSYRNADRATNTGLEFELNRRMDWVHPWMDAFSVFGNLTLMRSRVITEFEGDVDRPLVGQAPYVLNTGVTYSDPVLGISGTLLYNVVGPRIINARTAGGEVPDVVERPRNLVDVSIRFPVFGLASGKIDLRNLLDAPHEVTQGPVVREYHRSGRSVSFGLSWQR